MALHERNRAHPRQVAELISYRGDAELQVDALRDHGLVVVPRELLDRLAVDVPFQRADFGLPARCRWCARPEGQVPGCTEQHAPDCPWPPARDVLDAWRPDAG